MTKSTEDLILTTNIGSSTDIDTVTITLDDTFSLSDSIVTINDADYSTPYNYIETATPSSIKLGNVVLTEEKFEKLEALLDIIQGMEGSEVSDLINTTVAMNKIKGHNI